MRSRVLASAVLFAALPFAAQAAKVKTWSHQSLSAFDKAKLSKTVVNSQGVIRLAHETKLLANLDIAHVWDLVEDANGVLYAATGGDEGKLFRIGPDGKPSVIYASKESQILCLAAGDGAVYAGVGPGGKVLRIDPLGKTSVVAEGLGTYVWSLAFDPTSRSVYAGTGPTGQVHRIGADLKTQLFYATKQDHVLSLAVSKGGTVYAGVDKGGLVYRIDPQGKGFVLYHAHQNEVRSLVVADDVVYAGTSSPGSRKFSPTFRPSTLPAGNSGSGGSGGTPSGKTPDKKSEPEPDGKAPDGKAKASVGPTGSFAADEPKGSPAAGPATPTSGENSVYRIGADGSVRELFRDKTMILRLLRVKDRLLVGTGMQGQLFEIDEATKDKTEIARLDHGQIHAMLKRRDGSIVIGTGDPGKLYVLENRYAPKGTVVSEVLDAKIQSAWGSLSWSADLPPGTGVSVAVRAGNGSEPDETWSDWSAEQTDPATAAAAKAPMARYLQYRITLATQAPEATPEFRQLVLRYKTMNLAPEIASFDVPDLDASSVDNGRKLKLKWHAVDPNEDELSYRLYVRKKEWKDWVLLEENLEKKDYEWDATTMPSGMYQAKVVASDRRDNTPEETLTAERISPWIAVSHDPPTVAAKWLGVEGGRGVVEATATGTLVRLIEASYAVDGSRWSSAFPVDGIFDSKTETLRIRTEPLRPGTHVVVVRVRDAAGNVGTADVVFVVPAGK